MAGRGGTGMKIEIDRQRGIEQTPAHARVSVSQVRLSQFDRETWDANATRSGASLRSAFAHLHGLRLKLLFRGLPKLFHLHAEVDGQRIQIGQCTLIVRRDTRIFYDSLNL